jgi:transposase
MRQKLPGRPSSSGQIIKDIKRSTRKQYGAEKKIRIVLDGLRCPSYKYDRGHAARRV